MNHVGRVFHLAVGGLLKVAPQTGCNLNHRASRSSAFREGLILCRVATYLLCRACFVDKMRSVSIPTEADPSLRTFPGWELVCLDFSMPTGGFCMRPRSGCS